MDRAQFITVEDEEPALVLSFAPDDERTGVRSFILQRTPGFECLLAEYERGVRVSMEGEEEYENNLLETISMESNVVTVSALRGEYKVDISRVAKDEIQEIMELLKKINFDSNFKIDVA